MPSHKLRYDKQVGSKNNTYTLHVTQTKPYRPLRYEMIGYDHIMKSHYDHYIIEYHSFEPWQFDFQIFQLPEGKLHLCFVN